jgi:superfamily II DNA or RNA helicase
MRVTLEIEDVYIKVNVHNPDPTDHSNTFRVDYIHERLAERFQYETTEYRPGSKYNGDKGRYEKVKCPVFNPLKHKIPAGLLVHVYQFLANDVGCEVSVVDVGHITSQGRIRPTSYKKAPRPYVCADPTKPPRYYQLEARDAAIRSRYGHITLPTGAGKTLTMMLIIEALCPRVTLIAVDGLQLVNQTYDEVCSRFPRADVKRWDSKATTTQKKHAASLMLENQTIIVASYQSIQNYIGTDILEMADLVLLDEIQKITADSYCPVVQKTPYAYSRIGFSATPFRDDNSTMLVVGYTGQELYRKELKELVDEGYLSRPVIKGVNIFSDIGLCWLIERAKHHKVALFHEQAKKGVQTTKARLEMIAKDFSPEMQAEAQRFFESSFFVDSSIKGVRTMLDDYKHGKNGAVFTTPLMDVGVDIPDIDTIILVDVRGKNTGAIVQNIQRIGRGLRKPVPEKTECLVLVNQETHDGSQPQKPTKLYNTLVNDARAFRDFDHGEFRYFSEETEREFINHILKSA